METAKTNGPTNRVKALREENEMIAAELQEQRERERAEQDAAFRAYEEEKRQRIEQQAAERAIVRTLGKQASASKPGNDEPVLERLLILDDASAAMGAVNALVSRMAALKKLREGKIQQLQKNPNLTPDGRQADIREVKESYAQKEAVMKEWCTRALQEVYTFLEEMETKVYEEAKNQYTPATLEEWQEANARMPIVKEDCLQWAENHPSQIAANLRRAARAGDKIGAYLIMRYGRDALASVGANITLNAFSELAEQLCPVDTKRLDTIGQVKRQYNQTRANLNRAVTHIERETITRRFGLYGIDGDS